MALVYIIISILIGQHHFVYSISDIRSLHFEGTHRNGRFTLSSYQETHEFQTSSGSARVRCAQRCTSRSWCTAISLNTGTKTCYLAENITDPLWFDGSFSTYLSSLNMDLPSNPICTIPEPGVPCEQPKHIFNITTGMQIHGRRLLLWSPDNDYYLCQSLFDIEQSQGDRCYGPYTMAFDSHLDPAGVFANSPPD